MTDYIDLRQVVFALADTLDLVGVDEIAHGKRVGYMAFKCAEYMGFEKKERERLFQIGMLHDCGVSSTVEHKHLVDELLWKHADVHAELGARLLEGYPYFSQFAPVVRYHHHSWCVLGEDMEISAEAARDANLIFLVDRVDSLAAPHYGKDLLQRTGDIQRTIERRAGELFSPDLVEIFLRASASEAFWMMLEPPHLQRFLKDMERFSSPQLVSFSDLKQLAHIFATIVDAKSRFTFEHSLGVSRLARHLGEMEGLLPELCERIEVAGLLHDLGKLRVPDEVLDKPGALDFDDLITMRRHSFETYQILQTIDGINDIAFWAAYHHETPNGQGYPFHCAGDELSQEARIIAVADVFQALAQDRPYRKAMELTEIIELMSKMADENRLDKGLVARVMEAPEHCLSLAVSSA